jgi:hypothetical protein
MATIKAYSVDATAKEVGTAMTNSETNLMKAYSLKEGDKAAMTKLAAALGVNSKDINLRSIQLIAEQRFQQASQRYNLFSTLLDKIDQLKQRLINNLAN